MLPALSVSTIRWDDVSQYNIKFRPKTTDKMIGYTSDEIAEIKDNIKDAKTVLIYGSYGTGKTTLALAVAHELTDESSVHQANAGADGGIDEVRNMIKIASRRTLSGKRRVFIVDEAHKLTKAAIDALLIPLESEDQSTLFIFCSNEPERLPPVMTRRMLKIATPEWTEKRLLRLAKRVSKETGKPVPKNLKQFNNPSDMLLYMQNPKGARPEDTKKNVATARYILHVLLGNPGDRKVHYDAKYSTILEISQAVRGVLGLTLPYEKPDPAMMKMLKEADPKLVARVAAGCTVALADDTKPPLVLLSILTGAVVTGYHFEEE